MKAHQDAIEYGRFLRGLVTFGLFSAVASVPLLLVYTSQLRSAGEFVSGGQLAQAGSLGPIQWLSGYYDAAHYVKTDIAKAQRPRVLIVGSSRVMQFRERMFGRVVPGEFYNLGGGVYSLQEALMSFEELAASDAAPELMVLGVDWWWLQSRKNDLSVRAKAAWKERGGHGLFNALESWEMAQTCLVDEVQLLQRAWKDPRFHDVWRQSPRVDVETGRRLLGVGAAKGGFRNDGSFRYSDTIANPPELADRLAEGSDRLDSGWYRGNLINDSKLTDLAKLLEISNEHGTQVLMLLPPVDPDVLTKMQTREVSSSFWQSFPTTLQDLADRHGCLFFDLSDPGTVGAGKEEFIDWFHGSDTMYARLLLHMIQDPRANQLLNQFVDRQQLAVDLARAVSPLDLYGD